MAMKIKGKRSLSSRLWLNRQLHDPYVKRAQLEGYRSRAAFKLMEIDDKFHLIQNAKYIIDVGAAPGGWSQVLSQRSPDNAKIAAIDLLPLSALGKVRQFCGDFECKNNQLDLLDYMRQGADLIVSDMAPSSIGHAQTEHVKIMSMAESVYAFAQNILRENGSLAIKIFQGGKEKLFQESLRKDFQNVCFFKPKSSRNVSAEIYIIALGFMKCN
ncbi:MAG: RlmE family RNA methyltransferase [Holosporaceae bacterium]|jgi:23S rRNA (uridine2552-2'-O)-methyltransferase|nr:RlmE family RNA methyltransferase [Holosporaceae bacterium]